MSKLATYDAITPIPKPIAKSRESKRTRYSRVLFWCQRAELNCRHYDFQSYALPTELLWRDSSRTIGTVRLGRSGGSDGT
jgi:hypothetical protein